MTASNTLPAGGREAFELLRKVGGEGNVVDVGRVRGALPHQDEESLSVGRHIPARDDPASGLERRKGEETLFPPENGSSGFRGDPRRDDRRVPAHDVECSVPAPARARPHLARDLPLGVPASCASHVSVSVAAVVHVVRQPPAVRREDPAAFVRRTREKNRRCSVDRAFLEVDHGEVELRLRARSLERERPPVRREPRRRESPGHFEEKSGRHGPVGGLDIHPPKSDRRVVRAGNELSRAIGREHDLTAVRAPDGAGVVSFERQLREGITGDVVDEHVALARARDHDGRTLSVGRKARPRVAAGRARLLDHGALAVHDGEREERLRLPRPPRAEAGRGDVELGAPVGRRFASRRGEHFLQDRHGPAGEHQPGRVERRRVDRPLPGEEKVSRRRPARVRPALLDDGPLPGGDLDGFDDPLVVIGARELRQKKDRFPSRKWRGPAMRPLACRDVCRREDPRLSSRRGDDRKAPGRLGREDDRVSGKPGTSPRDRRVTDRHGRAARDRRLSQLSSREERDPLAVRREERPFGTFGLRHLDGL